MAANTANRTPRWMIACAVVLILTAIMHAIASQQEPAPRSPDEKTMLTLMKTVKLELPGSSDCTMARLLDGFSWFMSATCLGLGLTALMLALARPEARIVRKTAAGLVITLAMFTAISQIFFFVVPITCFGLALLLAIVALLRDTRAAA